MDAPVGGGGRRERRITDKEIQRGVLRELEWEPQVQSTEIGVSVKDGVVTLSGFVDSSTQKWAAERAAEAAEAAGAQGKFWEMHDTLFENQDRLEDVHLAQYAALLGLDVARFALELAEHAYAPRVREDFLSGVRSGVNGTPTFFINGVRHDDAWDGPTLLAALARAGAAPKVMPAAHVGRRRR